MMKGPANISPTAPTTRPRYALLDVARGGALLLMFVYHFSWDLTFFRMADFQIFSDWKWIWFAKFIASIILFVMGVAQVMARRRNPAGLDPTVILRRLAIIAVAAGLVSAATFIVDARSYIFFGILHHIAAASVILLAIHRLPSVVLVVLAAGVALAPEYLRFDFFNADYFLWLGLYTDAPGSVDYVPLLPWLALPLAGVLAGRIMFRGDAVPAMLAWAPNDPVSKAVHYLGRHSLIVYLIHQPILFGGLYAFVWFRANFG
ncbi:MAG: DUF1624 domain-containing protein [Rhodospirillaceae bacterium]|nr:DUF1624 domain-containing protein [Rhodospirillaceae bacterium]